MELKSLCVILCTFFWSYLSMAQPVRNAMARVTSVNITCHETGMKVHINFDRPFHGIVFSKGHYRNSKCRYVTEDIASTIATFSVPSDGCGSLWTETADKQSFENTIVVQHDHTVQETWDEARLLRCDWLSKTERRLRFRPIVVASLEPSAVAVEAESISCWMDVQTGQGPFSDTIEEAVQLGETLSLVVYAKAQNRSFDLQVKECYASDSPTALDDDGFDGLDGNATVLQLTDHRGCPLRPKLFGHFFSTRESGVTSPSDNTILAFALMNAFKFPDVNDVYLACNVAVCREKCPASCMQPLTDSRVQLGQTLAPDLFTNAPPTPRTRSKSRNSSRTVLDSVKQLNGSNQIIPLNDPVSEALAARVGLRIPESTNFGRSERTTVKQNRTVDRNRRRGRRDVVSSGNIRRPSSMFQIRDDTVSMELLEPSNRTEFVNRSNLLKNVVAVHADGSVYYYYAVPYAGNYVTAGFTVVAVFFSLFAVNLVTCYLVLKFCRTRKVHGCPS